ncbi:LysE family transporter [Dokdonella sp.]|uniref:LysE family translocator n=1 Tax=Dokdonella sp. TaxID=2291710 RepID=UPI001B15513B|nr:LysE family transporter [Dokdonella sp.]MBO9661827.1 LysE family transporter [Dokdonella sp.]
MNPAESLLAAAGLLAVAAITPGPNNLIVMHAAAARVRDALPAVAGIVGGGLLVLSLVVFGVGAAFGAWPWLRAVAAALGAGYLAWLGLRLAWRGSSAGATAALPRGFFALCAFQLANPKTWVMMLTIVAAMPAQDAATTWLRLAPLAVAIPIPCLLLWAGFGRALARRLGDGRLRERVDRALGLLLVACAAALLLPT